MTRASLQEVSTMKKKGGLRGAIVGSAVRIFKVARSIVGVVKRR